MAFGVRSAPATTSMRPESLVWSCFNTMVLWESKIVYRAALNCSTTVHHVDEGGSGRKLRTLSDSFDLAGGGGALVTPRDVQPKVSRYTTCFAVETLHRPKHCTSLSCGVHYHNLFRKNLTPTATSGALHWSGFVVIAHNACFRPDVSYTSYFEERKHVFPRHLQCVHSSIVSILTPIWFVFDLISYSSYDNHAPLGGRRVGRYSLPCQ